MRFFGETNGYALAASCALLGAAPSQLACGAARSESVPDTAYAEWPIAEAPPGDTGGVSAPSEARGTAVFEPLEIADADVQLESQENNVINVSNVTYVKQLHDCTAAVNAKIDEWLASTGLAASDYVREPDRTTVVVDIAKPTEGFLFVAYRRYDRGRRASVNIKFDSPQAWSSADRQRFIGALKLVELRAATYGALQCAP